MRRELVCILFAFTVACDGDGAGGVTTPPPDDRPPVSAGELPVPALPSPSYL